MKPRTQPGRKESGARRALRRRVMRWYECFNGEMWSACYSLVDPRLTNSGKVNLESYAHSIQAFHRRYGAVHCWHVRMSLHLTGSRPVSDPRPFAYVYTIWQDDRHEFHMFRERWVLDGNRWFTRVAGLVINEAALERAG